MMKLRHVKAFWIIGVILIGTGLMAAARWLHRSTAGPELVAKTIQELRAQGFKTELSEFNFSTSPELRAREAALTAMDQRRLAVRELPELMEPFGTDAAVVAWKEQTLRSPEGGPAGANDASTWDDLRAVVQEVQTELEAASAAALSGPIRFNLEASHGNAMLLRHLAPLKGLQNMLVARMLLALHDHDGGAAWTNWLAATRLVTAWEPEPTDVSQLVRLGQMKVAFGAAWQALQARSWNDEQLARLQREWESVDFLHRLPETFAFKRAADVAAYELARRNPSGRSNPPMFSGGNWRHPLQAWAEMRYALSQRTYWGWGQYVEERDLLRFDCDREIECRNAAGAASWAEMRGLPGVTNPPVFQGNPRSQVVASLRLRQISRAFLGQGIGLLGAAAEAEARRRVLLTALALERYRGKKGVYPRRLEDLGAEFLKIPPLDFMDGQPLRYRPREDGHYFLYSVGLDCTDDGGAPQLERQRPGPGSFRSAGFGSRPMGDITWPCPAEPEKVAESRRVEAAPLLNKADASALEVAEAEWRHCANHQADAEKVLSAPAQSGPVMNYHGKPLSESLRNADGSSSNLLTLGQMLTLKQVTTGEEPEWVTFELPISSAGLKKIGEIYLLVDTNNDDSDAGCVAGQMECKQAENGDCLIRWNTLFESTGKHALRAALRTYETLPDDGSIVGPPMAFSITNLCQFSSASAHYDQQLGAAFQLKLPETNGECALKCLAPDGHVLKTLTGKTSNGVIQLRWDLLDAGGQRFTGGAFDCVWSITLPQSGRMQVLKGP